MNQQQLEYKLRNVHPPNPFAMTNTSSNRVRFPSSLSSEKQSE